ncbi:MAG: sigma-70 family RNA polymerase sigma factor [Clostridia bacterium]|nr:sigma-70 family RNA polymerase sigma factor [Clostridia bacterium]
MSAPDFSKETELYSVIEKAKAHDQAAFEELLVSYTPLVESLVKKFLSTNPAADEEELRQEAHICFYRAILRFDTTQNSVTFGLFAKTCIQNGLVTLLRSENRQKPVSLTDEALAGASLPDPAAGILEKESYLELCGRVQQELSDYEAKIWWLYFSGRTPKEIANLVGKDEKSVTNAVYRIRKKLRKTIPNP